MNQAIQRSGLPLLIFAAAVLIAAAGVVILVASPFTEGFFVDRVVSEQPADDQPTSTDPPATARDDAPATDADEAEPAASQQAPAAPDPADSAPTTPPLSSATTHTVALGDTLFDLAGKYWSDPYLWPLLLVANSDTVADPDHLWRGTVLNIPQPPDLSRRAVTDAHVEAYIRYRELGDEALQRGQAREDFWSTQLGLIRVNKAHWVLYSGLRYDDNLLERVEGRVPQSDLAIVRAFVTRFGGNPGK